MLPVTCAQNKDPASVIDESKGNNLRATGRYCRRSAGYATMRKPLRLKWLSYGAGSEGNDDDDDG